MRAEAAEHVMMLKVRDLTCTYGKKTVLTQVGLDGKTGECIGIAGLNGSGKSTLLKALAGVDPVRAGTYELCGHDMLSERKAYSQLIGYVPQEDPLLLDVTAGDNLKLWSGRKPSENEELLQKLELTGLLKRKTGTLSGGERRRLAVASALMAGQQVLIMDEPTAALDLRQKEIIRTTVRSFAQGGGLVIMATHDIMEIQMCDRIYYLSGCAIREENAQSVIDKLMKGEPEK